VLGIVNSEIVKVTDESVQKEIYINTEVLGIVNGEIVKVTDENVQKELDINTEVLGIMYMCVRSHVYVCQESCICVLGVSSLPLFLRLFYRHIHDS
jgi:hypothetical protein